MVDRKRGWMKWFLHTIVRNAIYASVTVIFITGFIHFLFHAFPLAYRMASNADSLVMLDFARDLLLGRSIVEWNLPRVPYLFPDTVIALGVMAWGWMNPESFYVIAVLHYALLILLVMWVMQTHSPSTSPSRWQAYWQAAFWVSLALLTVGMILPTSFAILYWQLFASGAHFLSVMVVLAMMLLSHAWQVGRVQQGAIAILFVLAIAVGVSNSMAGLLLLIWCISQLLDRRLQGVHLKADWIVIFIGVVIGTLASTFIPRQSLVDSFFSIDKFIVATQAYWTWLWQSPSHWILMLVLLLGIWAYPDSVARQLTEQPPWWKRVFRSPVLWPSVAVLVATPLFFQEAGSIRYLAFPALVVLVSLSVAYRRVWDFINAPGKRYGALLIFFAALAAIATWQVHAGRIGAASLAVKGKDLMGLAAGANTDEALACLEKASAKLPLADGIATYWNARPTRFASQFAYYFAQINPWRPRSGYMVWGNNPLDFVYRDFHAKTVRQYNFALATNQELDERLWGSLPSLATKTVNCPSHRILYFDDAALLWNFLFPLEVPYGYQGDRHAVGGAHSAQALSPSVIKIFPADDFFTVVGERATGEIRATGQAGVLAYGPYIPLRSGRYRLVAHGQLHDPQSQAALLDVSTQFGKTILAQQSFRLSPHALSASDRLKLNSNAIAQLNFELLNTTYDVEFRLQIPQGTHGELTHFSLQPLD